MKLGEIAKRSPYPVYGTLVAVILLGFGAFRYMGTDATHAEVDQKTSDAQRLRKNVINSVQLEEHLNELKQANQQVLSRVARASDLAGNTQYFYKIQAESGVREVSLSPDSKGAPKKQGNAAFTTVAFTSVVEGKYDQILQFAQKLEGGAWLGRVNGFSVRQLLASDGKGDPVLSATIRVELLALP